MGKLGNRCGVCRIRKIKCDQIKPTCSQCKKAGWSCGGYRDPHAIRIIQYEIPSERKKKVFHKKATLNQTSSGISANQETGQRQMSQQLTTYSRTLYPAAVEQGLAFFMQSYVLKRDSVHVGQGGFHEYLPILYSQDKSERKAFSTMMEAVGLATLANARRQVTPWELYIDKYTQGLRKVNEALSDPKEFKADQTLAAVMLLGLFETITYGGGKSMKSLSHHVRGITQLIDLRGPEQFQTEVGLQLFLQLRRTILMTYAQLAERIPYPLEKWSRWVKVAQRNEELPANQLAEFVGEFVNLRADLKANQDLKPSEKIFRLLEMDAKLEAWPLSLTNYMQFTEVPVGTYGKISPGDMTWGCEHTYSDLWVSSIWGNLRMARAWVNLDVISLTAIDTNSKTELRKQQVEKSRDVLRRVTLEVCQSVSFHLSMGKMPRDGNVINITPKLGAGGFVLILPLFMCGLLETTGQSQRLWMAAQLRTIGRQSGNLQPTLLAELLFKSKETDNFLGSELWSFANGK